MNYESKENIVLICKVACIFLALFAYWYFCTGPAQDNKLIKNGNIIVEKIEQYKKINNDLPTSLKDIGENVDWDYPYHYKIINRNRGCYMLSFGMTLGESKVYYSDTIEWEDTNRRTMTCEYE
jgi:hypothetical protein